MLPLIAPNALNRMARSLSILVKAAREQKEARCAREPAALGSRVRK